VDGEHQEALSCWHLRPNLSSRIKQCPQSLKATPAASLDSSFHTPVGTLSSSKFQPSVLTYKQGTTAKSTADRLSGRSPLSVLGSLWTMSAVFHNDRRSTEAWGISSARSKPKPRLGLWNPTQMHGRRHHRLHFFCVVEFACQPPLIPHQIRYRTFVRLTHTYLR
jgi:hypothetical protein